MSRIDAGIILSGQQPNILARMEQGFDFGRKKRMANVMNEYGAGAMQGDQNAINALARFDVGTAQQARQGNLNASRTQQIMRHADANQARMERQERRRVEEYARKISAEQRAAEAQRIAAGVSRATQAYSAGDLATVNQILQSSGEQPIQSLEEFPAIAFRYKEAGEILKNFRDFNEGPKAADEYGRYVQEERAAGRAPMSRIEYHRAKQLKTNIETDGQGGVKITETYGESPPKMTVDAAKNSGFLLRTQEANEVLNQFEGQGTRFGQQMLGSVPLGAGNYMRDEDFQRFDQARRDFVNAILRRESGAVISEQEFDNADKQYFPVPGDGPEVIAQKRRNRETAIEGLRLGAGEGAAYIERQSQTVAPEPRIQPQSINIDGQTYQIEQVQ